MMLDRRKILYMVLSNWNRHGRVVYRIARKECPNKYIMMKRREQWAPRILGG